MSTQAPAVALAPVRSLGVVLAGCPACRQVLGLDGARGLAAALAAHRRACPKRHQSAAAPTAPEDAVCPGCGCEGELILRAGGWRCGDCLAELLTNDPGTPATTPPARPAPLVADATQRRRRCGRRQPAADPARADRAVVA